jgi:hypothetical protein
VNDEESRATVPTSTIQHNIKLDAEILNREPPDEKTLDAPWAWRIYATLASSVRKWLGTE